MQTEPPSECDLKNKNIGSCHSPCKLESMDDLTNHSSHGGLFSSGDMTTTDSVISDLFSKFRGTILLKHECTSTSTHTVSSPGSSGANLVQWDQDQSSSDQQQPAYLNNGDHTRGASTSNGRTEHPGTIHTSPTQWRAVTTKAFYTRFSLS